MLIHPTPSLERALLKYVNIIEEPTQAETQLTSRPQQAFNETGTTYTVLQYPDDVNAGVATTPTTLKYVAKDCDSSTGLPEAEQGYQGEYMLKDLNGHY
ncbi:hypothetical protein HCN44_006070 [Aphidius gifuensis]|uniref:Coatomer gamma subunit appendage Ig-like subdomain domain-containing protein n=1 Tax=Aphidius gifuensis TaxID=684658 RepID=A0A835CUY6_APHGI|nr:hypothetical protein HCN44_006070 [Aphidius gifuensis]